MSPPPVLQGFLDSDDASSESSMTDASSMHGAESVQLNTVRQDLKSGLATLKGHLEEAAKVQPRPVNLIVSARQLHAQLEAMAADPAAYNERQIKEELYNIKLIKDSLDAIVAKHKLEDRILARIPYAHSDIQHAPIEPGAWRKDRGEPETVSADRVAALSAAASAFAAGAQPKDCEGIEADTRSLKSLLRCNIKQQCWREIVEACLNPERCDAAMVAALSAVLSDRLSLDIERHARLQGMVLGSWRWLHAFASLSCIRWHMPTFLYRES